MKQMTAGKVITGYHYGTIIGAVAQQWYDTKMFPVSISNCLENWGFDKERITFQELYD